MSEELKCRAEFEAWATQEFEMACAEDNATLLNRTQYEYVDAPVENAWTAWHAAWCRRAAVELSDDELQKALKSAGMEFNIEFSRKLYNAIIAAHRSATNKENLLVQEGQE